ncbi:MAG TPA: choice-of-anchor tandem repeat GloVer-containing protein [Verrucomicrobiae bacterium]|nr:choice-of-anchor tandem repeat GloVer-containing protein [Verrucomicrobiae bacterium]
MKTLRILAVIVLVVLFGGSSRAGTNAALTTLHTFSGADGSNPQAALVQGSDGYFYGTTQAGGSNNLGTVFQISSTGTFTPLYQFSGPDGSDPEAPLVQGSDGNFYGTTVTGGTATNCHCGTVFQITSAGILTTLFSFSGDTNGANPRAALAQGRDGNFYGTTLLLPGGHASSGTVFKVTSSGTMTTLYTYNGSAFGFPAAHAGLVQDSNGDFYGTTEYGGTDGNGSVFKIGLDGTFTNLFSITDTNLSYTGEFPCGTLAQGSDSNFYGTTIVGGKTGSGTVFQITPAGTLTTLHFFNPNGTDGANPYAGPVLGSDGNFYGTTGFGGSNSVGDVFRISPSGTFTQPYQFSGPDGRNPQAALVQGCDGNFYGTTYQGGTNGAGTVFKLSVPLSPPANQISAIQFVNTNVVITIPSVWPETYQLQYRDSLTDGSWSNIVGASITNSIGGLQTLTDCGGAFQPQRFYRFHITP